MKRIRVNCPNGSIWAHRHESIYRFESARPRRLGDDAIILTEGRRVHVRLLPVENGSTYFLVEVRP